ncbi:CAPA peptides-like isoform X1 [Bombus affinis]|uniref:CAPA peptides-like isoform X1 n=1 Tax=Bombus affinis TaxID=309941 RepID=UPI0021B72CDA|nr:CAPA peptides-like isoform X1 [Bombus affinis]
MLLVCSGVLLHNRFCQLMTLINNDSKTNGNDIGDVVSQCGQRRQLQSTKEGVKLKLNDRRASGLMAYPRVGRSDVPIPNLNFNRRHAIEPDTDFQFYSPEFDSVSDKDYEDVRNTAPGSLGRSMNLKHADKFPKEASWLISDRIRSPKDYQLWQKIDDGRFVYPGSLLLTRGSRNIQLNGYTPRLGRENDDDRTVCK